VSHRTFRLSISPASAPEVRRVLDFDGRSSLHDVHRALQAALKVGGDDHLYAFFLSGSYWDSSSEYVDPRTDGVRADKALLFRLQLQTGQRFVYVYDYDAEHRYALSVVTVTEAEAPLPAPVLVESVGDAPALRDEVHDDERHDDERHDDELHDDELHDDGGERDAALAESIQLARALLEQLEALNGLDEAVAAEARQPLLRRLGEAALALAHRLDRSFAKLSVVDRELEAELIPALFGVPARLSEGKDTELSVRVAEALQVYAPDDMKGEIAKFYAQAGDRERALELVLTNLETAAKPYVAEYKAGDVYSELGESDAAEVYYRRALAIAESDAERNESTLRITTHLIATGRVAEAAAFVAQQEGSVEQSRVQLPVVGRNEPCPCGSGKKYKKCHGA
jgi:uncharacterized protein YchJ